jgi:thioredoxin-dependent peroxiredoxin
MNILKTGEPAPLFKAENQHSKEISIEIFKGKKIILYFYPKDMTPGCTAEACNLRDNYHILLSKGFVVIGISADPVKSHQKFSEVHSLPFHLIADTGKNIIKSYGAWGLKKFMGREFEGILRKTFVIDENGSIVIIIDKVDTKNHTEQILNELNIK